MLPPDPQTDVAQREHTFIPNYHHVQVNWLAQVSRILQALYIHRTVPLKAAVFEFDRFHDVRAKGVIEAFAD